MGGEVCFEECETTVFCSRHICSFQHLPWVHREPGWQAQEIKNCIFLTFVLTGFWHNLPQADSPLCLAQWTGLNKSSRQECYLTSLKLEARCRFCSCSHLRQWLALCTWKDADIWTRSGSRERGELPCSILQEDGLDSLPPQEILAQQGSKGSDRGKIPHILLVLEQRTHRIKSDYSW